MRLPALLAAAVLAALATQGCAGSTWEQVRSTDTPIGYRRFLAENPHSKHAAEARERLALQQLERTPELQALENFRREYPGSAVLPELEKQVEARSFDAAQAESTPAAYERFLQAFPGGALQARAASNLVYLKADGFSGHPDRLAEFVRDHPESDYAVEGRRILVALDVRQRKRFGKVGLRIEIAADVRDADRLRGAFVERARAAYQAAGVVLVDGPSDAVLEIRHAERPVSAQQEGGLVAKPGTLAETRVSVRVAGSEAPVFEDLFSWRVADADRQGSGSVVFAAAAAPYWDHFYVPVATWPTSEAQRVTWGAGSPLSGVGAELGHAVVVAPNGGFRELDLSDPTAPRVVGTQSRSGSMARFTGARRMRGRVVLFGEDGAEIFVRQGDSYRITASFDRGAVGAVAGVEECDGGILMAGTRGLVRTTLDGGVVERLIERPLRGIARMEDTLYLLDDQSLYAGSAIAPRAESFSTIADVGRALEPGALRVGDSLAVVVGKRGVAMFALSGTAPAQVLSRLRGGAVGAVSDGAAIGGKVFLVGERGVLVIDPRSGQVLDSVDVEGRAAVAVAGTQLVAIGGDRLAVLDTTPWTASGIPAAITP